MEWRDIEVWRRQRPYVSAEIRKDSMDHLTRLGLAASFALVVGMAEGARLSALKGDLKFPFRYAVYNVIPSFVGGKVPPSNVAFAMATAPPLRACPRAAAQATNLRALRTAVAGCTVLSIILQVTLAGGRGAEAYEQAVAEGREVPSLSATGPIDSTASGVGGVVRLCGARGLEPALGMTRRGGFGKRVLPVVITGRAPGPARASGSARPASLPDGALAAVAECSPRPCYYRIDPERLFCREAWQPVASAIAEAVSLRGRQMLLVIEADTLSSDLPQALLAHPGQVPPTQRTGDGGSEDSGRLGADQAVWGLAMLRKALEEGERRGRVASVVLAETRVACLEESTVIIDARAALLLSILSWAQQCAGETVANAGGEPVEDIASDDGAGVIETVTAASTRGGGVERKALAVETRSAVASSSSRPIAEESKVDDGAETENAGESASVESAQETSAASRVLGVLEQMGRGVRVVIAPDGRLRSTINRSLGFLSNWLEKRRLVGAGGGISRVLVYDTDDDDSFRWLATQMLRQGWTVRRVGDSHVHVRSSERLTEETASDVPVLVHHSSDEKTLSAAAGHLARGGEGTPVCAVVHRWDCGVEARRLLLGGLAVSGGSARRCGSTEVICTAEVGEDLFQYTRGQLRSGAPPGEVQKVLDDLFGCFCHTSRDQQN